MTSPDLGGTYGPMASTSSPLPDFQAVASILRERAQATWATGNLSLYEVAHESLQLAEREMAAQAVVYLYDHLAYHEQWREAAMLLAYCLPTAVHEDPRVRAAIEHAATLAATVSDPAVERASCYAALVHQMSDAWVSNPAAAPTRSHYWMLVARLARARVCVEYATGCGANVFQATERHPGTEWIGVDISRAQIVANREQAERTGNRARFLFDDDASIFGTADVVAVLDVLEHSVYPDEILTAAERYARRPGGFVCVTVPNGPWCLGAPKTGEGTLKAGEHLAVQTVQTLAAYLTSRGRVVDCQVISGSSGERNSCVCMTYELL